METVSVPSAGGDKDGVSKEISTTIARQLKPFISNKFLT